MFPCVFSTQYIIHLFPLQFCSGRHLIEQGRLLG